MKNFVITIKENPRSVKVAERCIESGKKHGIGIEMFRAITPLDKLEELMHEEDISPHWFEEKYSRQNNCMAAFMSHYLLWKRCYLTNEEITVFEHDAFIEQPIPDNINYQGCINLGQPSYGRWNDPLKLGVNPLTSKRYFPGAHAYRIKPKAAKHIVDAARYKAGPTDVFLNIDRFPFLEEYYPWPVVARDSFTTIQNENGIQAKHTYIKQGGRYEII